MERIPKAKEIMTRKVHCLTKEMGLYEAMDFLLSKKLSGAPVVDEENRLVGMVSEYDLIKAMLDYYYHESPIDKLAYLMNTDLHTLDPDDDLFRIMELIEKHRLRRIPVVVDRKVIGLVTRSDLLRSVYYAMKREKQYTPDFLFLSKVRQKEEFKDLP